MRAFNLFFGQCLLGAGLCGLMSCAGRLEAENVVLLTSYNLSHGASLAYSDDSVEYDITVHAGPGSIAGNYTLTSLGTLGFTVDSHGNIVSPSYSGGSLVQINPGTVTFSSSTHHDMSSNVDGPRPPQVASDPHRYPAGGQVGTYQFNLVDTNAKTWWKDTETYTAYFYWEVWQGFYQNPTSYSSIGATTNAWRKPLTKYVKLDAYLRPHPNQDGPTCPKSCCGMAAYSFDMHQGTLRVNDTPLSYHPPVGPGISFTASYNQADLGQLSNSAFAGLSPQWTYNWLSYLIGDPDTGDVSVTRFVAGGGLEYYQNFQVAPADDAGYYYSPTETYGFKQSSAPERSSQAVLTWDPAARHYVRTLPDGSYEIYGEVVLANGVNYYLLSQQTDAQGNSIILGYDTNNRLITVTDAIGQVTKLYYASAFDEKIDHITDPFGRTAKFTYDSHNRLQSSVDPQGIVSTYGYDGTNFLNALTTPYGTTAFSTDSDANHQAAQATNPLGQTERVELRFNSVSGISDTDTVPSPTGATLLASNSGLSQNNTYYWDRRQYTNPPVYPNAVITHWMPGVRGLTTMADSGKKPLEGRVWYNYSGQTLADYVDDSVLNKATITARILDNGTTQAGLAAYTGIGLITKSVDPLGRTTNYYYDQASPANDPNNIDLFKVTQSTSSGEQTLSQMSNYYLHLPQTVVDTAGQTTTMTYNGQGQLTSRAVKATIGLPPTLTTLTTTLAYTGPTGSGAGNYLTLVTGPVSGATTSYTYDSAERVHAVTDSENYSVITAYDNLDRPTSTTYPDGTTDQTFYKVLDVDHIIDRQGRVTRNAYDAIRELVSTTDPLNRTTKYGWCTCGGLSTLTDANNNVTTWNHDLQGRVTSKVYADSTQITYTYDNNLSRLHAMTDANGNGATYAYNTDNTLDGTTYTLGSGSSATPNVSFTYDPAYNRVLTMVDGTGTTSYTYNPITGSAVLGAGRLASVTSPIVGTSKTAAVTYSYDEMGRGVTRDVDQATTNVNNIATTFDALGRVTNVSNALGAFVYAYVNTPGPSSRLASVTYPTATGLVANYSYFGNTSSDSDPADDDERLATIQNMHGSTQLSKFSYSYNPVGTIATWTQQADSSTAVLNTLSYDGADQLTGDAQSGGATTAYGYGYDPAGNRLTGSVGSTTNVGQFNNLNQLTRTTTGATSTTVAGHTSAAVSSLNVNAVPATITGSTNFTANVPLPSGTNLFSVVAQPTSGAVATQRYQVVTAGSAPTVLSYDKNGNVLTDENGNTYQWDALNRLTKITYPNSAYSTFAYDGLSRRVQIAEYNSSHALTGTKNYLWIGSEIAEERNTSNAVQKRFFPQGEQQSGTNYYYTRDHLGSVREMCSSTGTIVSRMAYDPNGVTTLVSGSNLATKQYAGMYLHQPSGEYFTKWRIYDPLTATWRSRDPIGENGGYNLYEYVNDDPTNLLDPSGKSCAWGIAIGGTIGAGIGIIIGAPTGPGDVATGSAGWIGGSALAGALLGCAAGTDLTHIPPVSFPSITIPRSGPGGGGNSGPTNPPTSVQECKDRGGPCEFYYAWCLSQVIHGTTTKSYKPYRSQADCLACYLRCKTNGGKWSCRYYKPNPFSGDPDSSVYPEEHETPFPQP